MTEVAFHFNAPSKLGYAPLLVRKGYRQGAKLMVRVPAPDMAALDTALWTLSPNEFIAHARQGDPPEVLKHSPVWLYSELPEAIDQAASLVLINLCSSLPPAYERFARVIEIVTHDGADRAQARERWRAYKQHGIEPVRYDLQGVRAL